MSRRRLLGLCALVLTACQAQSRRLLLLDEALSPAAALEATARPWIEAGYHVEYRRFYPHLTRRDLDTYRVVILLGGQRPGMASDALGVGDLALLTEWTLRGGVVVLGYPPAGDGALDRWLMNRWLAWSRAGIRIGSLALQDSGAPGLPSHVRPIVTAGLRGGGFDPFPAGTNDALRLRDPAQALARASAGAVTRPARGPPVGQGGVPVIAASRVARGLVIVVSRSALASLGRSELLTLAPSRLPSLAGTETYLVALARWTRRPAEWARIPPAFGRRMPLPLAGATLAATNRPPRAAPPGTVAVDTLGGGSTLPATTAASGVPDWIDRQGVRALLAEFPALAPPATGTARLAALDTLSTLMDIGAFNVLLADARVQPLADSADSPRWQRDALRAAWDQVAQHLQATSVRWIPLVRPAELERPDSAAPVSRLRPCPLDTMLWDRLATGLLVLARFAATHPDPIPAIGVEIDSITGAWAGPTVCDAAWQVGLSGLTRDSVLSPERAARLTGVPLRVRYDSLLDAGLLAAYDAGLAGVVRHRAMTLRNQLRRIHRGLLLAVLVDRSPGDWFTASLVGGLADENAPVLVFSPDPHARELLALAGATNVVPAIRLDPDLLSSFPMDRLEAAVYREQDGFWIGPAETILAGPGDRLARQIRRISRPR